MKNIFRDILRYFDDKTGSINSPEGYQVVMEDFFTVVDSNEWHISQPWGEFHPKSLHQYYGKTEDFVRCTNEGLVLDLKNKPKTWIKRELPEWQQSPELPEEFTIPVGVGLVCSKKSWQWGWFEAWVRLPEGQPYWPAFWLSGANSWPPEIDVFEAYSDITPKYGKKMIGGLTIRENWKIQPNLHYGNVELGTKKMYGPYNVPVVDCTERFVQYVCHWEKDFIRIYYDGNLIFECKDPQILNWYNDGKAQMNVIFNHGLMEHQSRIPNESSMVIKYFRVLQNKN